MIVVKGTCQIVGKEYIYYLPTTCRIGPSILKQHLSNLKTSYKAGKVHNGRHRDYDWYCSQFKALHQDLMVQRISNELACCRMHDSFVPPCASDTLHNNSQHPSLVHLSPTLKYMPPTTTITNSSNSKMPHPRY